MKQSLVILLLFQVFISLNLKGQYNEWVRVFHPEANSTFSDVEESYDYGYLVSGWFSSSYPNYCWLTKTDINGNILWEKVIGDLESYYTINEVCINQSGSIFVIGSTGKFDIVSDPILIKLNACGEKEWCKVFHTLNNYDFGSAITSMPDGGCVLTLRYTGFEPPEQTNRICMVRMDAQGNVLWRNCYLQDNENITNEDDCSVALINEDKLLISGHCYYEDNQIPGLGWIRALYVCTDLDGNVLWETFPNIEEFGDDIPSSEAWTSCTDPNGNFIYSGINHRYGELEEIRPAFHKTDMQGNIIESIDLMEGYPIGSLRYQHFVNDSILVAYAGWGDYQRGLWLSEKHNIEPEGFIQSELPTQRYLFNGAVKFDTLGNIIAQKHLNDELWAGVCEQTHDNKYLILTMRMPVENDFDTYLYKLNENLEYDSIYTQPYEYDYLCDHEITNDTIGLDDCDVIIGIEDHEIKSEDAMLQVFPNPASDIIVVRLPLYVSKQIQSNFINGIHSNYNYHKDAIVQIYDLNGLLIGENKIQNGQTELIFDVSNWKPGMYMVRLLVNGRAYDDVRLVVMH